MALEQSGKNKTKVYWQTLLSGFVEPSILGIKKTTQDMSLEKANFAQVTSVFSLDLQIAVKQFSQTQAISIATLLQGVWASLVSRYSGSDDVVFGSQFSNLLPVRVQIQPKETAINYLQRLQQQLLASRDYHYSSLTDIQNWSELSKTTPLFEHIFLFTQQLTENITPSYPLSVIASDTDKLTLKIIFDERQYSQFAIQQLLFHYQELLKSFLHHPQEWVTQLSLLTADERQKILIDWNEQAQVSTENKLLHELFQERVEKTPNNIAIIFKKKSLTYSELNQKTNQLAHYLQNLGVKPDTLVAICMERSLDLVIGIFAILKAGGAYLPLESSHPQERLAFMLEDSRAPILLIPTKLKEKFSHYQGRRIVLDECWEEIAKNSSENVLSPVNQNNLAYVIYTSGSTGKPKGVLIEHKSIVNTICILEKKYPLGKKDAFLFKTNHTFDVSLSELFGWIFQGGKLVILKPGDEKEVSRMVAAIEENKITHVNFVPSVWQAIVESVSKADMQKLKHLKYLFVGGEAISKNLVAETRALLKKNVPFINLYGPTEAAVWTTDYALLDYDFNSINVPIGKPLASNMKIYILDRHLQPVPIGVPGELFISGVGLARGYLNRPDLTAEKFIANPFAAEPYSRLYKTGDACRYLPDGNIEYIERIDHQVKIHGFRIELGEIEASLATHAAINKVVVLVREDQPGEKILVAYYVTNAIETTLTTDELHKYLQQYIPEYMIPVTFVKMAVFPLNVNGKLDRKALPQPNLTARRPYLAPRTTLEHTVAVIWSEVFNLDRISVEDNFFELGGHSLTAARIIEKIRNKTHKEIKLADLYKAPSIAKLTVILHKAGELKKDKTTATLKKTQPTLPGMPLLNDAFMFWLAVLRKLPGVNTIDRRRVAGKLNLTALSRAFDSVFKKHPLLTYKISTFSPMLFPQKKFEFQIDEHDITHLSEPDCETTLTASLDTLRDHTDWKKARPLIVVKLFYLKNNRSELQICLPHLICDEISTGIIFTELSKYYLSYQSHADLNPLHSDHRFADYLLNDYQHLCSAVDKEVAFWFNYSKDADYAYFPEEEFHYQPHQTCTTILELSEKNVNRLQKMCAENQVSFTNCFCAIAALATARYSQGISKNIAIMLVKSARGNDTPNDAIGDFIRFDLIKTKIDTTTNLIALAKSIQQTEIDTGLYQSCPLIFKSASLRKQDKKTKINDFLLNMSVFFYTTLFYKLKLNSKLLVAYIHMIQIISKKNQGWNVVVNIMNNFVLNKNENANLFALRQEKISTYQGQVIEARDRTIAISLFRETKDNKIYLKLDGNLKPAFREKICQEMLKILDEE